MDLPALVDRKWVSQTSDRRVRDLRSIVARAAALRSTDAPVPVTNRTHPITLIYSIAGLAIQVETGNWAGISITILRFLGLLPRVIMSQLGCRRREGPPIKSCK